MNNCFGQIGGGPGQSLLVGLLLMAPCLLALDPAVMQSMVIVEGDQGRGSGFILRMPDGVYLITNAHVIQGNQKLSFKTLANQEVRVGTLEIADTVDLVRARVMDELPALPMLAQAEKSLEIGEGVIVAGNAEGEGVVREITGKVMGIGPDRVEVDATFVPGNSGSPILRESSGEVIGVATYLKIPRFFRQSSQDKESAKEQPVTSLNEVRRFGYRLDTVGRWLTPQTPRGLVEEGMRLDELDKLDSTIIGVVRAGTTGILKTGSTGFIPLELRHKPSFAALAKTIDEFAEAYKKAEQPEQRREPVMRFLEALKRMIPTVKTPDTEEFHGFFAARYQDRLEWRKGLHEWLDFKGHEAGNKSWILESPWWWGGDEAVDIARLHLPLTHEVDESASNEKKHRVSYPEAARPASLRNLFWIIESPRQKVREIEMTQMALRVSTPSNGVYKVRVEHRAGDEARVVSNEIRITVDDIPPPSIELDFSEEPALVIRPDEAGAAPDWKELARLVAGEAYAKTPMVGHDGSFQFIKDIPAQGAILTGFECVLTPFRQSLSTVRGVRPVFLTDSGQITGSSWGAPKGNAVFKVIAKPGYAVGKISGQFDGIALRRLKVRFDRICGLKLDPKDSYETDWIGQFERAEEASVETHGRLPIGLSGNYGAGLDGLRLVCLSGEEPAKAAVTVANSKPLVTSMEQILQAVPTAMLSKLGHPASRKAGQEEVNRLLAGKFKGRPVTLQVQVEQAAAIERAGGNAFRLKAPDASIKAAIPMQGRLWFYFKADGAPKETPAIGSVVKITGVLGRCDVKGTNPFVLNLDVQQSKIMALPEAR